MTHSNKSIATRNQHNTHMQITINITAEDAAILHTSYWGELSVSEIIESLAKEEANTHRANFPESVDSAVAKYKENTKELQDAPTYSAFLILWHGVDEWCWFKGNLKDAHDEATCDRRYMNYDWKGYSILPCDREPLQLMEKPTCYQNEQ